MPAAVREPAAGAGDVSPHPGPPERPTHPKGQTFVLLAGVFVVVLLLALLSTVTGG